MDAREYLEKVKTMDREINARLLMIEELETTVNNVTSILSDMPRPMCRDNHARQKMLCKVIDMKIEMNDEIDAFVDYKGKVMSKIRELDNPDYRIILVLRYIKYRNWDDIADTMDYKRRRTFELHNEALAAMDKIL